MIYVTSDLHGYPLEEFVGLLKKAGFGESDHCFVLGDVIDRGSDGIKILRFLMRQPNFTLLRGNHEDMMLSSGFLFTEITDDSINSLTGRKLGAYSNWMMNGGMPTIDALRGTRDREIKYIYEYLKDAPLFETVSTDNCDFVLTHSGLGNFRKDKKLSEYTEKELLWTRPSLDTKYFDNGIITVFGHTPTAHYSEKYSGRMIKTESWINIDAGVAYGFAPMLLRLDDMKEFYMENA